MPRVRALRDLLPTKYISFNIRRSSEARDLHDLAYLAVYGGKDMPTRPDRILLDDSDTVWCDKLSN